MENFKALFDAIVNTPSSLPIRFMLDGARHDGFDQSVKREADSRSLNDGIESARMRFRLADTLFSEVLVKYDAEFGAIEWTVWFENDGNANSPVISGLDAARISFECSEPVLKGILGDHVHQYRPYEIPLKRENASFYSDSGRPTHVFFPYFHLKLGGGGIITALGWGGTWEANFACAPDGGHVEYTGRGTNGLDTYLKPGERIRTPLMLFLPYEGLTDDGAMNLWRRYYIRRVLPKQDGAPIKPMTTTGFMHDTGLPNSDGSISERHTTWKPSLDKMLSEGIHMDMRWFDAGWYTDPYGNTVPEDWWGTVGAWELDPEKWPGDTFKSSCEYAAARGILTLMWFEPERVTHVDALCERWGYKKEWALGDPNGKACGNDIGNPECLAWTLGRIIATLEKGGAHMYREDNNFSSRPCWAAMDAKQGAHRAGITENKAVSAHYALWDAIIEYLRARGGVPFVDSCASGGGRNDLESMKRGVPLLRSDSDRTTTALRLSMTTAFNQWIPYCGACSTEQAEQLAPDGKRDEYILRASYLPVLNLSAQWIQDPGTDFGLIRRGLDEWRSVSGLLLKDFYALTPWRDKRDVYGWTAFAYACPDTGDAALFAFRMEEAQSDSLTVGLEWLDASKEYEITDADTGEVTLIPPGAPNKFTVTRARKRSAALFRIRVKA